MLSITSKNIFVKGFVNDNVFKFIAPEECGEALNVVITDLTTTAVIKIAAATRSDNAWVITCMDGSVYTLEEEPDTSREIKKAILAKNFKQSFLSVDYATVFEDEYDEVIDDIKNNRNTYCLIGFVNEEKVVTGTLVKMWKENEKKHGITRSGTHYVWD